MLPNILKFGDLYDIIYCNEQNGSIYEFFVSGVAERVLHWVLLRVFFKHFEHKV